MTQRDFQLVCNLYGKWISVNISIELNFKLFHAERVELKNADLKILCELLICCLPCNCYNYCTPTTIATSATVAVLPPPQLLLLLQLLQHLQLLPCCLPCNCCNSSNYYNICNCCHVASPANCCNSSIYCNICNCCCVASPAIVATPPTIATSATYEPHVGLQQTTNSGKLLSSRGASLQLYLPGETATTSPPFPINSINKQHLQTSSTTNRPSHRNANTHIFIFYFRIEVVQ